jgi:hypothetical protein
LLSASGVDKEIDLMSSDKFAELLRGLRRYATYEDKSATNKPTLAFSKTDQEFLALAEHPDVECRL